MEKIELDKLSEVELKALAYNLLRELERLKQGLDKVNNRINYIESLKQPSVEETKAIKDD